MATDGASQTTSNQTHELAREVDALWSRYDDPTGRVLNVLNDIQDAHRFLPEESLARLAELSGTPLGHLRQMADFFDYLSLDPVGRVIVSVCDGTACHTQNAPTLLSSLETIFGIRAGQTTPDGNITLRTVGCVGACGVAPVIRVEDTTFGSMALSRIQAVADEANTQVAKVTAQEAQGHDGGSA